MTKCIKTLSIIFFLFSFLHVSAQNYGLPVFISGEGFGFDTKGGADGRIVRVTNLKKSGKGSLADAIKKSGPRVIVFEVGGVIDLEESRLRIENPFITIAGQTAPDPGITLIKGGISITTHEVILQHIRVRPGEAGHRKKSGWEIDGIATSQGAFNVIIDHCSAAWATDENISASGPRFKGKNVTEWRQNTSHKILISNCIIAEGLSHSTHGKGEHSKGSLIHDNATEIAIIGNLYASNYRRNPLFKGGTQGIVVNNYVFNPGHSIVHYNLSPGEWKGHDWVTGKMTVEGNVFEYGKDTWGKIKTGDFRGPVQVYWKNNLMAPDTAKEIISGSHTRIESRSVWPEGFSPLPAGSVKENALKHAGARPWDRDQIDQRIIQEVKNKTNRIIDSEQEVGGYPEIEATYQKFDEEEWDLTRMVKIK